MTHSSILIKVERGGRNILAVAGSLSVYFSVSTNFFHILLYQRIFSTRHPHSKKHWYKSLFLKLQDSTLVMILVINATLGCFGLVLITIQNIWKESLEDIVDDAITEETLS